MHNRRYHRQWLGLFALAATSLLAIGRSDAAIFLVTNTNNAGPGSLRAAILDANLEPGGDQIQFEIPGDGPHMIQPTNPLPIITDTVAIEGVTQPGSMANTNPMEDGPTLGTNAVIKVILDGSLISGSSNGLHIQANACVVYGIGIQNFRGTGAGLYLDRVSQTLIIGNFIGTDSGGYASAGNRTGVLLGA